MVTRMALLVALLLLWGPMFQVESFIPGYARNYPTILYAGQGFGASKPKKKPKIKSNKKKATAVSTNQPYRKDDTQKMIEQQLAAAASNPIGQVVSQYQVEDDFWELMPSLIASKFPRADLSRIAGFVNFTLAQEASETPVRPIDWIEEDFRPYEELHAYMPGLAQPQVFHDPATLELCQQLEQNYETIRNEYETLVEHKVTDRFQSVTSMNYESGWKTLVLFYNGHRIKDFPYELCPVTTRIMESVPLAGRIAGFNRQAPQSGIPAHTDGNNMWLTCQMGIDVPPEACITVGDTTRHWENGQCLLYDTTYVHETFNPSASPRVVLHVDFFNTLSLSPTEIQIMRYIYSLREEFLKAEGVQKVGAQIL